MTSLGGELVGGEVAYWWRVGWWRDDRIPFLTNFEVFGNVAKHDLSFDVLHNYPSELISPVAALSAT